MRAYLVDAHSHELNVLRRYKQCFDCIDPSPVRGSASSASSQSRLQMIQDSATYPHPLNSDIHVVQSRLRWPLEYLPGGSLYGQTPTSDALLPANLAMSATSDVRRLANLG